MQVRLLMIGRHVCLTHYSRQTAPPSAPTPPPPPPSLPPKSRSNQKLTGPPPLNTPDCERRKYITTTPAGFRKVCCIPADH